ncbi:MAG: SCO family protein [Gemmatimonadota bacterium]
MPLRLRTAPVVALAVAGALLALPGCGVDAEGGGRSYRGTTLAHALPRPSFTLTDTHGQPFDFRSRTDHTVTLLFFGYLNCPDVCPVHLTNIAAVMQKLPYDVTRTLRVVFVTTDPGRDTPEKLQSWLANFDSSFVGLRGTPEQVRAIEKSLELPPAVADAPDSAGDYQIGHAAQVIAFAPDDSAHVVYPFGTRQADWLHDLPLLAQVK